MPARRRKPKVKASSVSRKRVILIVAIGVLFAILFFLFRFIWERSPDYFTIASVDTAGDIKVEYIDTKGQQIYSVVVPKDTEVNLAMQRGVLRAHSIEKLLSSENLPGQFLSDTVMKTFHFPVDYWKSGMSSDLPFVLALKLKLMRIRGASIENIDLSNTSYLIPEKLTDGEDGYKVRETMPLLLQSIFADPAFSKDYTAVQIVNRTGEHQYYLHDFIKVLEVMGVKVAPIVEGEKEAIDCVVKSLNTKALEKIAGIFNCEEIHTESSAFDLEIIVGEKFYERF